jgi:Alkylmercury lyase
LIRVRTGLIDIAYPFSAAPTQFLVRLPGGRDRYACCATDALGIAPMIGERIEIRTARHHCSAPLEFSATPEGVGPEAEGMMLWFCKRSDEGCKAFDSL